MNRTSNCDSMFREVKLMECTATYAHIHFAYGLKECGLPPCPPETEIKPSNGTTHLLLVLFAPQYSSVASDLSSFPSVTEDEKDPVWERISLEDFERM
ncbi:hypothetical protein P879_10503 [Paragonimus westermani]|uniref:Uncharacterized protein n=1 Tax=Paragonimus westermani TaxID=34504 RepID=A0A8T0DA02_9TREM|nr:hypothetical protein P879_10503 [Paragonimus westermani]